MLTWHFSPFDDINLHDWYAVAALRADVFVVEQNCPFQDHDGADQDSWHLLGWETIDGKRTLVAYCRLVKPGIKYAEASIGRVVTARAVRSKGYGRILLAAALARHASLFPGQPNRIGAQQRLEKFYREFGFETVSAMYIEDDIPHVEMLKQVN